MEALDPPVAGVLAGLTCRTGTAAETHRCSGETIGGVFMGVISCAISLSLHEALGEDLPGRQARGPHTPNLPLIDPRIFFGGCGEADVCEDVEHRLAGSRRRLAIAGQCDPVAVVGLDDQMQVEFHATIGAHPHIIDAVRTAREAALVPPIDRKVESGTV